ncbi:GTPase domain-containing protein [Fibrobacter sp. UWB7]|uniref:GTPase domain-containing protein n=1 Tax=Fibrobacter sp. UWB7 TaxID=1896206 RepID=UPI0009203186|nr:GTPase domain-containing protein [Fibrobacter sp. UWB7]SHN01955.1 Dynamin family protein [Fibrobacter sp. UWB7]
MEQNSFKTEILKFVEKLDKFSNLLTEAKKRTFSEELEKSFESSIEKVASLKNSLQDGKLRIALVGAFSDGKTSTVAGFLGHADSNMKIAEEESSDEVIEYKPENIDENLPPCLFVDTPGLFGQKYSEKTEKFVSEAHIILYIVAATNPLKDSHKETVAWLMNKLNKFDNTIFVINRMDDVCDYTDPEDFAEKEKQKKEFLIENITRFCGLNKDDAKIKNLNIVCISSDPEGKGLQDSNGKQNYWLTPEKREKYEKYSRMQNLRDTVNEVVKQTLPQKLIQDTALTAIIAEVEKNFKALDDEQSKLGEAVIPETKNTVEILERDLNNTKKDLKREIRPCREELESLEKRITTKIRSASVATLQEVVEDEIGDKDSAHKLEAHIQDILRDHFENIVNTSCQKIKSDFDLGSENIDSSLKHFVKAGADGMKSFSGIGKATVFAGRDILGKVGIAIKFKPWGAVKVAGMINKGVPIAGAAISLVLDIFTIFQTKEQQEKFANAQNTLIENIHTAFKDIYKQFNEDGVFFDSFAPQIYEIEKQIDGARTALKELENNSTFCNEAKDKIKAFLKNETFNDSCSSESNPKGLRAWIKKIMKS